MEVWDDKLEKLDQMKEMMKDNEEMVDEELISTLQETEMDVRRSIKYDVDSFLARAITLDEDYVDCEEVELETSLTTMQAMEQTYAKYDKKLEDFMDKLREDYKDISFLECIVYTNLVVFSLAATVAYLFYQPPGSVKVAPRKDRKTLVNIPVNFASVKVPKKEIKKQLNKIVKNDKDTSESML